jgi:broad specificity phosphatase PhoE
MTQTVWIARHGNRLDFVDPKWFNTAKRRYDPPLSEDGLIQARELATRLKSENITHIFASPFLRTIQTANEVAQVLNLPIKPEAGLSEWLNPNWMDEAPETHSQAWLAPRYPLIDWSYQSLVKPQYPETEAQLYRRTAKTIQILVQKFTEDTLAEDILIVGHGGSVLGTTRGLIKGNPTFKVSLCSLTKIVNLDDTWNLELTADTSHLSQTEKQIRLN